MASNSPAPAATPLSIIYICNNDGSDPRIAKEIRTLSQAAELHFVGIGSSGTDSLLARSCASFRLISGRHDSPVAILHLMLHVLKLRMTCSLRSAHVVNEQLLACVWPVVLGLHTVLDVFDSMFLRLSKAGDQLYLIKRVLYGLADRIIVTDEPRRSLLPTFARTKAAIIPNVPFRRARDAKGRALRKRGLTIAYFGSLQEDRGTKFARRIIEACPDVKVLCAGWPADEESRRLIEHEQVEWLGVISQADAFRVIVQKADFILSVYPGGNLNNLYASPNKLYDAIHTQTPLVASDNFKMVEFIREHRLGYIIPQAKMDVPDLVVADLKRLKGTFEIDPALAETYCWEHYEELLIDLHQSMRAPRFES